MAEFIIEIPSVDDGATVYCPDERHGPMSIEPLVRCRDCKHEYEEWGYPYCCRIPTKSFETNGDNFCGFAERRDA